MAESAKPSPYSARRRCVPGLAWLNAAALAVVVAGPMVPYREARAQSAPAPVATSPQQDRLSQAQLEQLLAPIALHPDELLMQMLMAATYPLEIVQAKRWLGQGQNAALRGDALVAALNAQSWDPSVKSLVPFPDVLTLMNDQLEWTQQLGDAVLGQQEDVLNTIQVLRGRAQANGALQSGPQQTVNVTQNVTVAPAQGAVVAPPPQVITIAPTQPETIFVPVYDPNVVFGTWPHASYPPAFFPPPVGWGVGNALLTGMAFAGGAAIVGSLWGWGSPNWGGGNINVNANRYNNINVNRTQISGNTWRHDTTHRQGVAYRNDEVRNRVNANRPDGSRPAAGADRAASREQFRGRVDQAQRGEGIGAARPGGGDRPALGDRPGAGQGGLGDRTPGSGPGARPGGAGERPNLADRTPGDRPGAGAQRPGGAGERPNVANRAPGDRPGAGAQRPGAGGPGGGAQQRPQVQHNAAGRPQARPASQPARAAPQGLQGLGDGGRERAAAQRGAASRQGQGQVQQRAAARPAGGGGGGARAGGGGGGPRGGGGGRR